MGMTLPQWRHVAERIAVTVLAIAAVHPSSAWAQRSFITIASTTSTEQSGLFKAILPVFTQATGIEARVVALGTGQALDVGRRGDADVVFVHDPVAEEKFLADGFGVKRLEVMYNDFVVVGPRADPECGCGMGPALNMAASTNAYVLADRGTWLSFKNRGDLAILVEGDKTLFNQYGVMVVNPVKHPHVKAAAAQRFADWVVSPAGQASIAGYKIGGEQLFFPNARP